MNNPDWFADSCAVLIGVSAYEYAEYPPIRAARNSLRGMHALLKDPELCGWPSGRIRVIANPISAADLAVQLADIAENTTGALVLYYVGHGVLTTRGELCLTVTSTRPNRPKITGVPWDTIADTMRTSPARVRIAILDCCFAGQAIESLVADTDPGLADLTHVEGVYTLTATTRNHAAHVPPPDQQDTECTSFTGELLGLIRAGIPHKPPWLTLDDIYPILRQRLVAKGLPTPNQRGTDTANQFRFAANMASQLRRPGTTASERGLVSDFDLTPTPVRPAWAIAAEILEPSNPITATGMKKPKPAARDEVISDTPKAQKARNRPPGIPATLPPPPNGYSSGQGSRLVEINLSRGEYKLAWSAGGDGNYFRVTKERPTETVIVSEVLKVPGPTTGELLVRLDGSGRQIFSVDASNLEWSLTFTVLK